MKYNLSTFFKRVLKIFMWIVACVILLLTTLVLLIRIPAVQNTLVQKVTAYLTDRTKAEIAIKKILISFPNSVSIEGLLVKDLNHNTLLSAGNIQVGIDMFQLIHKKILINKVLLSDITATISRSENDSLYNFNFLIEAFAGSPKNNTPKDSTKQQINLDVNKIELNNIHFIFNDRYAGIYTSNSFKRLHLSMKEINLNTLIFKADELELSGLNSKVIINKKISSSPSKGEKNRQPIFSANSVKINNSIFSFSDYIIKQSVTTVINNLQVKASEIDLNTKKINSQGVFIAQSSVRVNMTQIAKDNSPGILDKTAKKSDLGWIIKSKDIQLDNIDFGYNITNVPAKEMGFDAKHINYQKVSLNAFDLGYSNEKIYATVNSFSALDPHSFQIKELTAKFTMTKTFIEAQHLKVKTGYSSIEADAKISFTSLEAIADSIKNLIVHTHIKKSKIYPFEILYFAPQLVNTPTFKNNFPISLSALINGPLSNVSVRNLKLTTAASTALESNFKITGLPNINRSYFNILQLKLKSTRADIIKLAGRNTIPKSISLPEELSLTGKFSGYLKDFTTQININSSFGNAEVNGSLDKKENFKASISSHHFNLNSLLNNKMFGPVTLHAKIEGSGLDTQSIKAHVIADIEQIYLNKYNYKNLKLSGSYDKKSVDAKISLNDSNAVFDLAAYVNLNSGQEEYNVNLDLKGVDLKKLNLMEQDIKLSCNVKTTIKGKNMNTVNGNAGITNIIIASKGKKYFLDSLVFASINQSGNSEMKLSSSIIGFSYKGTFAPTDLVKELKHNIHSYFAIDNDIQKTHNFKGAQQFSFTVQINNHPILSEVFLPELKEFEPGEINGSYSSDKNQMNLNFSMNKLVYGTTEINALVFEASSDEKKLNYKLITKKIATSKIKFDNLLLEGRFEDQHAYANISSTEENGNKKLVVNSEIVRDGQNYKLSILPNEFYLMNEKWEVSQDNFISFGKSGLLINNIALTKSSEEVKINTPDKNYGGEIDATIKNFKLDDISRIIEKDTGIVKGTLNGNITLKPINNSYGFNTDLIVNDLNVHEIPIGTLILKANNITANKIAVDMKLNGAGNNISVSGYYIPNEKNPTLEMKLNLEPLTAQSLEALSFGQIRESSGNISGKFDIKGNPSVPEITGTLQFEEVTLTPAYLNSKLYLKSEKIKLDPSGLYFNSFTLLDKNNNSAVVNGNLQMKKYSDFKFDLTVNTSNFLLLNTSVKDNEQFYGRMIVDSKIRIKGSPQSPVITSALKLKNGSHFTFAVTEKKLTTDKGNNVVLFVDSLKFNPILTRNEKKEKNKSTLRDFDISSTIEIDKKATIRLMLDPDSNDSLVVRGEAALSFGLDPSGKTSLTGVYNITEGSYGVSLENIIKKKFIIQPGSTIVWNGDPLDALININAVYKIRTSPIDLVAGQLLESELASYRQRYPFDVLLKLRGAILTPLISFEIQLQAGEKGAAGGSINAKLEQLNDNPSALNKQVFALLVLNRFIQENPLQTETDATANAARTTVGKFLSSQLNQLSSKVAPGVDINFNIQSYDDYSSGKAQGRTQVGMGLSKQLFNERINVQVGGSVDVEGEKAKKNSASDITGDVIVEYKITPDGRYRLKGFRNNQYQGALEGQIIQTGAGVLYVRDFNEWIQLFTKEKKDSLSDKYKNALDFK